MISSLTPCLDAQTLEGGDLPPPSNFTEGTISRITFSLEWMCTHLLSLAPQSPQEKLERFFDTRPTSEELKQRNILKDSKVAPALQAAQAELERKRLEDELSAKLSIRPKPDELVDQNILSRTSPSLPPLVSRLSRFPLLCPVY